MRAAPGQAHPDWRTGPGERRAYGLYFMGQNAFYMLVYMFLATYLLLCGLDAGATAGILLVVKVWDAVNDCLFGGMVDRVQFGRGGRFLPWLRISLLFIPLATMLLFAIPRGWTPTGKLVWFAVAYILWDTAYTLCDVPAFGLVTTMTDRQEERTSLMTTGRVWANFGVLLALALGYLLPSEAIGCSFTVTAGAVCLAGLGTMLPLCLRGKERFACGGSREEGYSLGQMFQYLGRNKYLLIFYAGYCVYAIGNTATAVLQFASFYLFHSALLATAIAGINFIPAILVGLLTPRLLRRWSKYQLLMASMGGYAFFGLVIWAAGYGNLTLHLALSLCRGAFMGGITVLQFMFTPDCAEYGRYKTGTDARGLAFAVQTFAVKLTAAVSAALALGILGLFGWVSVPAESFEALAAMGVAQPPAALGALWFTYAMLPGAAAALSILVWTRYRLTDRDVELMTRCNLGEITRQECQAGLSRPF